MIPRDVMIRLAFTIALIIVAAAALADEPPRSESTPRRPPVYHGDEQVA